MALEPAPVARDMPHQAVSMSGLNEGEAKEFHKIFLMSFIIFTAIAVVAHFLVYTWRPWLPPETGYTKKAMIEYVLPQVG